MQKNVKSTVGSSIEDLESVVETLAGEMRSWYDNMPEGPQSGSKGQEVESVAETLEAATAPDVPVDVADIEIEVPKPSRNKRRSRSLRLSDATTNATIAKDAVEAWLGSAEADNQKSPDGDEWDEDLLTAVRTFVEDLDDYVSGVEVEFPKWGG